MNRIFIGEKIKQLRGRKSILEFAKLCNVSPKTISALENDNVNPRLETILKIAEGLNMELLEIIKILKL